MLWHVARQACYNYVHHIKKERSFRDTLVLDNEVFGDAAGLVWVKKDEIRYKGRMFDIKRQLKKGGVTVLVGHYDDAEHYLYKFLGKLFDDDDSPLQKRGKHWQALTAILPEETNEKTKTQYGFLVCKTPWLSRFHYSINIPPLHNPPDMITGCPLS